MSEFHVLLYRNVNFTQFYFQSVDDLILQRKARELETGQLKKKKKKLLKNTTL